jgi:homoserine trans-succinylase
MTKLPALYDQIQALEAKMYDTVLAAHRAAEYHNFATVDNYIAMLRVMDREYKDVVQSSYVNWQAIDTLKAKMGEKSGNR